jgi:hypothetical protein
MNLVVMMMPQKKTYQILMPKFQKGHTGMGGRPPGSKNKQTERIRQMYADFLENNLESIQMTYESMLRTDPKAAAMYLIQVTNFILPKLGKTDITTDGKPFQIILPSGVTEGPKGLSADDAEFIDEDDNLEEFK